MSKKVVMDQELLKIRGGNPLHGEITASGAKNAITKMLVASLLSDKKITFENVPNIGDVEITVDLCKEVGMQISWDKKEKRMQVHTPHITTTSISQRFSGANRIPILMLGALLGRTKEKITVPIVGGDALGKRPVDFHVEALKKLGASVEYFDESYSASAEKGLSGAVISLSYPSVGATENAMLAAARAKGMTIINNAALEPEVIDLILFMQKMGINIMVDSDRTIRIEESHTFSETTHRVIADRNEIASYALAAVSTKGRIFIKGAKQEHMIAFLNKLREAGGAFEIKDNGILFYYDKPLRGGLHIETDVHPGFMTDWQQPFCVLLTQAKGSSVIHETVYENRFGYCKILREMGAKVELFKQCLGNKDCRFDLLNHHHSLIVKGPTPLIAKSISIPDLRAGFAYVMAALLAAGTSTIANIHFLDRGYEEIERNLSSLGADIQRVSLHPSHS